jgi:hypothetical protein
VKPVAEVQGIGHAMVEGIITGTGEDAAARQPAQPLRGHASSVSATADDVRPRLTSHPGFYPRTPERLGHIVKGGHAPYLHERVEASVELARRALDDADPCRALANHLSAIAEWQANDRGFTGVYVYTLPAHWQTEIAKDRVHAHTVQLIELAHAAGVLRSDIGLTDLGLLVWAVVRASDGLRQTQPDIWCRHLALLLDGMRPAAAHPLPGLRWILTRSGQSSLTPVQNAPRRQAPQGKNIPTDHHHPGTRSHRSGTAR